MRTLQREICLEDLISRIPGLFAYIEYDENGNSVLHHSYDAVDGCYRKVVTNIKIPKKCGLYTYRQIDYDENFTYNIVKKIPDTAKYNDDEYIKVNNYTQDNPTDPDGFNYYKRIALIKGGNTYSYATIIRYYHQYKKNIANPFISFINKGIGIERVPDKYTQKKENYLVPRTIYLSQVNDLYEQYQSLSLLCHANACSSDKDFETCCKCKKYENMGGDEFKEYIKTLIVKAKNISDEMFSYADGIPTMTFDLTLSSSIDDLGYMSSYIKDFVPGECLHKGDIISYNGRTYICNTEGDDGCYTGTYDDDIMRYKTPEEDDNFKPIGGGAYSYNETYGDYYKLDVDDDSSDDEDYQISGQADSKLTSLRRFVSFVNEAGFVETPVGNEDWLFYYRIDYVTNTSVDRDEYGNIKTLNNAIPVYGDYFTNLVAYGDVITNITRDTDNRTITFTYILGAHLKAKNIDPSTTGQPATSSDGTPLYYYDTFEYDRDDQYHGVTYTETYQYDEGGEIDQMTDTEFSDYVESFSRQSSQNRYAFHPLYNSYGNISIQGDTHTFQYTTTNFNATILSNLDMEYNPLFHNENYVNSVFEPKIDSDVNIFRGNGASFERHFKLGEVKTVTAMEEYANGGFFTVMES